MARDWREDIQVGDLVIQDDWSVGIEQVAIVIKRTETPKGPLYDLYFPQLQRTSYSWDHYANLRRVT